MHMLQLHFLHAGTFVCKCVCVHTCEWSDLMRRINSESNRVYNRSEAFCCYYTGKNCTTLCLVLTGCLMLGLQSHRLGHFVQEGNITSLNMNMIGLNTRFGFGTVPSCSCSRTWSLLIISQKGK